MILYNTTFIYEPRQEDALKQWVRDVWLPQAAVAGMTEPLCARVPAQSDDASSMAVQGRFADDEMARRWETEEGSVLLDELFQQYGERILAFSTLMEVFQP